MSKADGICLDCWDLAGCVAQGHDNSKYKHTLTNTNAVTVRGCMGKAMEFDGTNYVTVTNSQALLNYNAMSIEILLKYNSIASILTYEGVFKKFSGPGGQFVAFTDGYSGHHFRVSIWVTDGWTNWNSLYGSIPIIGEWYYYTITASVSDNFMGLYENGILVDSDTCPSLNTTSDNLILGSDVGGYFGASYRFDGIISSYNLYNRALHYTEIKRRYQSIAPFLRSANQIRIHT